MISAPILLWPSDWPKYKQDCFSNWDDCCDMLVGPCRCGAWHHPGEFTLEDGELRRNGKVVKCQENHIN